MMTIRVFTKHRMLLFVRVQIPEIGYRMKYIFSFEFLNAGHDTTNTRANNLIILFKTKKIWITN